MISRFLETIKQWFAEVGGGDKPKSESRDQLATTVAEIELARQAAVSIESRIGHLKAIITAGVEAERELQDAVASTEGAAALAAFSSGRDKGSVGKNVANAKRAAQAADVARRALPAAERDLATANVEVARLCELKKKQISVILIEHGDLIARRYAEAFRELTSLHDHLVGFARGSNISDIVLAGEAIEVPRFRLPSLPAGDGFSPFMRHIPDPQAVRAASIVWSHFAAKLSQDARAAVSNEIASVVSSDALSDLNRHPEHTATIMSWVREREESAGSVNEIVYGGNEPRERRQIKIVA